MADTTTPTDLDVSTPAVELDHVRDALRCTISMLTGRPTGRIDPAGLLDTAREIQRLVDTTITELTALASRDPASPPLETLLAGRGTIPRSQVQAEIDRARVHETFPDLAIRARSGAAHTANIDILARLTRSLDDTELAAMAEHDDALADAACRLGEDSFRKRITRLRNKIRADGGTTAAQQVIDDSYARITPTADRDAHRMNAMFDPIRGATISAAVAREAKHLADHPELCVGMTPAQIAAQALHDLIVRGDASDHSTLPRPSVQIHVLSDWDTLQSGPHDESIAETFDGVAIGTATLGRLCCDATMRRVATTPDADVHVARPARSPNSAQRAALRALYPSCPISGAGWESIEIHHVIYYEQSKRTVLSELVPLSRRWHHLIHDDGWKLTMDPDRTLHLSRPDGTHYRTIAPPVPINQRSGTKDQHDLAA